MSMIMITHDLGIVAQTCDDVAVMYSGVLLETGTADQVFNAEVHHPYTVGLFNSIPRLDDESDRLKPIPGLMPDPSNRPKGCPFAPRCPQKTKVCEGQAPAAYNRDGHIICCNLYAGKEDQL